MGMKFLNKKGWHTGSLQNIERVWKAEQKDDAEKRKLVELRKQIHEERERDEFRQLQEQAGFAPRQERLEFLYDSGLSVGKSSNEGFSALQSHPPAAQTTNSASAPPSSNSSAPGALFEEKPQSANDAWRKLHSDPLLMIRQREQEALAQIKNNPVKMAMIRKSLEAKKKDDEAHDGKQKKVKSKRRRHSSSKHQFDTEKGSDDDKERKRKDNRKANEHLDREQSRRDNEKLRHEKYPSDSRDDKPSRKAVDAGRSFETSDSKHTAVLPPKQDSHRRRGRASQLSEEERAARLKEMQMDAELHEENRWKRLKKAEEDDAREASKATVSRGKSFLDAVQKSVYGAEKGGSSTIEESVRRRSHFLQGRTEVDEHNAFRR